MLSKRRRGLLALALIVLLSQIVLTTHAVTHFGSGIEQCQLCLGHAKQSNGLAPSPVHTPVVPNQHTEPGRVRVPDLFREPAPYDPRAPPSII